MRRLLAPLLLLILYLTIPQLLLAQGDVREKPATGIGEAAGVAGSIAGTAGYAENPPSPATIAGTIVQTLLGLVGVLFMILIIMGGFKWMTAGGNEEDVKKAKTLIVNATIGLVIVFGAWAIYITIATVLQTP